MKRLRLIFALGLLAPIALRAQASRPPDPLPEQLDRIFNKQAYAEKAFGPFQWLEGGKAYTTVEPPPAATDGRDIVRYDSATGARQRSRLGFEPRPGRRRQAPRDRRLLVVGRREDAS